VAATNSLEEVVENPTLLRENRAHQDGAPGFFLFMQEGQEQSEKIIRDELGAFAVGWMPSS